MIFRRKDKPATPAEPAPDARASIDRALRFSQKSKASREVMASQSIRTTLLAIEKAMLGLDRVSEHLGHLHELLAASIELENEDQRQILKDRFNAECHSIDETINACTVDGTNLIGGGHGQIQVPLSDSNNSHFLIVGSDFSVAGMGLASANATFHGTDAMKETLALIDRARAHVQQTAKTYSANAAVLTRHLNSLLS